MATSTPNLNLRKPDTSDFVAVTTDINDNMDTIDDTVGSSLSGPCCIVTRTSAFTVPDSTDKMVPFSTAERNDSVGGSPMWSAGSPGRITIRKTGTYFIIVKLTWLVNTTGQRNTYVSVNGATDDSLNTNTIGFSLRNASETTGIGTASEPIATAAQLTAGDILRVVVRQSSGANLDLSATANGGPMRFAALWIPPYLGS